MPLRNSGREALEYEACERPAHQRLAIEHDRSTVTGRARPHRGMRRPPGERVIQRPDGWPSRCHLRRPGFLEHLETLGIAPWHRFEDFAHGLRRNVAGCPAFP